MMRQSNLNVRAAARTLTLLLAFLNLIGRSSGVDWLVGGETQKWNFPPSSAWYEDVWTKNITFRVGDQLSMYIPHPHPH